MRVAPRFAKGLDDARRLLANSHSECVRKGRVYLCGTLGFFCHWRDEGRQMELDVDHSTTYMCYVLRSNLSITPEGCLHVRTLTPLNIVIFVGRISSLYI